MTHGTTTDLNRRWLILLAVMLIAGVISCGTFEFGLAPTQSVGQRVEGTIAAISTDNAELQETLESGAGQGESTAAPPPTNPPSTAVPATPMASSSPGAPAEPTNGPPAFEKATPHADSPAAGICPEAEGEVAEFSVEPGIPNPRCQVVRADQLLRVVNQTDANLEMTLGIYTGEVRPGEAFNVFTGFGDYLMPGVHLIQVEPCCGPSIWLKP